MAPIFVCLLLVGRIGGAIATSDNNDFVQSHLRQAPEPVPVPAPTPPNTSAPTPSPTPIPYKVLFRITFLRTWGDDHVCLTEMEFYDQVDQPIVATLEANTTSSCWGCAVSCDSCTVDYGNPYVLFDGDAATGGGKGYWCSDFASFDGNGENGKVSVTFALKTRPAYLSLHRPDIQGTAIAKEWVLEEVDRAGEFHVIARASEMKPELTQTLKVAASAGACGRWWEYETQACMSHQQFSEADGKPIIQAEYHELSEGGWQNNGRGIFYDGALGGIVLPEGDKNTTYYGKIFHFQFPSQRLIGTDQAPAVGELHIAHQKADGFGTSYAHQDGIAIVVIPLRLPLEGNTPTSTETWFEQMGLMRLPVEGETKPLVMNFSLMDVFGKQLNGTYNELDCHEKTGLNGTVDPSKPRWLVTTEPAYITGKVVQAFKDAFPYDTTNVDDYSRTYIVEGKVEHMGYDKLGREHLVGISQKPEEDTTTAEPTTHPDAEWVHDPNYVAGCGEFMPYGEWYLP